MHVDNNYSLDPVVEMQPQTVKGVVGGVRRTLFDITDDMAQLADILVESGGDITNPEVEEYLNGIIELYEVNRAEFYRKVEGWCAVIREYDARANFHASEEKRHAEAKAVLQRSRDNMKQTLCKRLNLLGIASIDLGRFKVVVKGNGGKAPVEIDEKAMESLSKSQLSKFCRTKYEFAVDSIREHLANGKKLPWARIKERGTHVEIK